jgi:NhaP-type Na+/H+ or K+/H+ antiporter
MLAVEIVLLLVAAAVLVVLGRYIWRAAMWADRKTDQFLPSLGVAALALLFGWAGSMKPRPDPLWPYAVFAFLAVLYGVLALGRVLHSERRDLEAEVAFLRDRVIALEDEHHGPGPAE